MKEPYNISFSGGRTSAYMTKMLIDNYSDQYNFIVTFANTGLEVEPKTLDFVNNCDKHFGFNTVWLEADIHKDHGVGTTHKIVTYETASRNAEPFEEMIKVYGIPNASYLHCTRELKLQPMKSYLRSLGLNPRKVKTAIGIRWDEERRVSEKAELESIVYPLVHEWPTTKFDVLKWWEQQAFDLGIDEYDGNCVGCFKKTNWKLYKQMKLHREIFENFHARMEELYSTVCVPDGTPRAWFRGNTTTLQRFKMCEMFGEQYEMYPEAHEDDNGGCTESCEMFPMEVAHV